MQSEHVVGASSSLVQREECHHLAPADTSIPLQSVCVWRDATADLCRNLIVYERETMCQSVWTLLATTKTCRRICKASHVSVSVHVCECMNACMNVYSARPSSQCSFFM